MSRPIVFPNVDQLAYHEAGHVTAIWALGVPARLDDVVRLMDANGDGSTPYLAPKLDDRRALTASALMALAGAEAGERAAREGLAPGPVVGVSAGDTSCVNHALRFLYSLDEFAEARRRLEADARELVAHADFWIPCREVAHALRREGEITLGACIDVIREASSIRRVPYPRSVVATSSWSARDGGVGRIVMEVTVGELFFDVSPEVKAHPERFRPLGRGELVYIAERDVVAAEGDWSSVAVAPGDEVAGIHAAVVAERSSFRTVTTA